MIWKLHPTCLCCYSGWGKRPCFGWEGSLSGRGSRSLMCPEEALHTESGDEDLQSQPLGSGSRKIVSSEPAWAICWDLVPVFYKTSWVRRITQWLEITCCSSRRPGVGFQHLHSRWQWTITLDLRDLMPSSGFFGSCVHRYACRQNTRT